MEVPRLEVKSGVVAAGLCRATATQDPNHVCNLHYSSQQHWIPHPLSKARGWSHILLDTSWIRFWCTTMGTPKNTFLKLTNYLWIKVNIGRSQTEGALWRFILITFLCSIWWKSLGRRKWGQWFQSRSEMKYRKMWGNHIFISLSLIWQWSHLLIQNF